MVRGLVYGSRRCGVMCGCLKLLAALRHLLPSRAFQVVGGIYAHSLAIITDAAHLLSDVSGFAVAVSWLGVCVQGSSGRLGIVSRAPAGRLRHAQPMAHCGAGSLVVLHASHPRAASLCFGACVQVLAAVWAKRRSQEHFSYGYHRVEVRWRSRAARGAFYFVWTAAWCSQHGLTDRGLTCSAPSSNCAVHPGATHILRCPGAGAGRVGVRYDGLASDRSSPVRGGAAHHQPRACGRQE